MDQLGTFSMQLQAENVEEPSWLPPGFRFHPTDDELIEYLRRKVFNPNFRVRAIQQLDLKKNEPWELPGKSKIGEKEWYFFTLRDRKYPTGMRTNRATQAGYWKGTGKDREVFSARSNIFVGMKKTLVFYKGRAPKGEKTSWIMHEYRLDGASASLNLQNSRVSQDASEWVVCRIFHKMPGGKKAVLKHFMKTTPIQQNHLFLPPLHECSLPNLATDDPELEYSDDHSGQQVISSFTPHDQHARLPIPTTSTQNSHWIEGGKPAATATNSPFLETSSASSTFGFGALPYISNPYLNLMHPLLLDTHVPKVKREEVLQTNAAQAAVGPNLTEENDQHLSGGVDGQKIMDCGSWLEGGGDYGSCSDQPLLNLSSCIPMGSPLLEINEDQASPILFKNGVSSPEDLSCFWNYI